MATIPLSAQVMFDLYLMCCTWEWENACKKAGRTDGDTVRPVSKETPFQRLMRLGPGADDEGSETSPFKYHRPTLDKVFRVLRGLNLITELQVKSMRTDRDLQNLFYRRSRQMHTADSSRHDLEGTKEPLIYLQDMRKGVNKKRLTRDIFYYPTANGQAAGRNIANRYKSTISKDAYFAEIAKQEAEHPRDRVGMAAISSRYRAKIQEETGP